MFRKQNPPLDDCTEVLEDESKSILLGIIAQLGKGMDLHRVTLPTFALEPRSMLERITDFMSHPDLLLQVSKNHTILSLVNISSASGTTPEVPLRVEGTTWPNKSLTIPNAALTTMQIQNAESTSKEEKTLFFDAATTTSLPCKHMILVPDHDSMESRRLWGPVTRAVLSNNLNQTTHHKTIHNKRSIVLGFHLCNSSRNHYVRHVFDPFYYFLEEKQRQRAKESVGVWQPRYFSQRGDGSFDLNLHASIGPNNPSDAKNKLISTLFTKDQQSPVVVVTPVLSPAPVTHLV
ncbi:hypothetical protein [Absidia glauca]|uniref:Uncharacterized protein n=1 Tax=Absidia glauca TaxID=4829 RepID=A0A168T8G0_ABSGL|nr:hypothetical protein [Absidia glauca]